MFQLAIQGLSANPAFTPSGTVRLRRAHFNFRSSRNLPESGLSLVKMSSRPVFFSAALKRALKQPLKSRIQSISRIGSFACESLFWFLTRGVQYAIPTLLSSREAIIIPLPNCPNVKLHVYPTQTEDAATLPALLSALVAPSPCLASRLSTSITLMVHGGAWGSGSAKLYSSLATSLRDRARTSVIVLSYPVFPAANVNQQIDAVTCAIRHIRTRVQDTPLIVLAHSSGAHIVAVSMLRQAMESKNNKDRPACKMNSLPDALILIAGVFHLGHHFLFESRRGVAHVSPMQPAAEADDDIENLIRLSPSHIAETMETRLCDTINHRTGRSNSDERTGYTPPGFLEGDIAAHNIPLPPVGTKTDHRKHGSTCDEDAVCNFPSVFLLASSADTTVPLYSSIRFACALRRRGAAQTRLLVYDGIEHDEFMTHWFDQGSALDSDLSAVLDISKKDVGQRKELVRLLHGRAASQLLSREERDRAPTAHLRDILRIHEKLRTCRSGDDASNGKVNCLS